MALIAPTIFELAKVFEDAVVVIYQVRAMLKDIRAGKWPPRHFDTLGAPSPPPPEPPK
jgi:hypothetical protein